MLVQLEVTICSDAAVVHLARVWQRLNIGQLSDDGTRIVIRDPAHVEIFWQQYVRLYAIIRWQKFVYMYHGLLDGHTEGLFYFYQRGAEDWTEDPILVWGTLMDFSK